MDMQLHGIIDGKHIELKKETGLPAGSPVLVQIQSAALDLVAQQQVIEALCGAWADDPSLSSITRHFENVEGLQIEDWL